MEEVGNLNLNEPKLMREQGVGIKKIAAGLNVGVGTVYKAIEAQSDNIGF